MVEQNPPSLSQRRIRSKTLPEAFGRSVAVDALIEESRRFQPLGRNGGAGAAAVVAVLGLAQSITTVPPQEALLEILLQRVFELTASRLWLDGGTVRTVPQ